MHPGKKKLYKKKILFLVDYYLPGYRAGGPIRSIANFVEKLAYEFDIYIICNDHDILELYQYKNVNIDSWNIIGGARVFYSSKKTLSVSGLIKILNETDYDLLHFNSFFSFRFTIVPLLLSKFKLIPKKPYIICPRGNLSPAALNLKSLKKKIYIKLFKWFKLFKNLNWQASSEHEKKDILNIFGKKVDKIFVVPDFTPLPSKSANKNYIKSRTTGALRLLFLSRISPMKNLDFFLRVLIKVNVYVELSIFGPKEDLKYWKECLNLIDKLPSNVKVTINDEVPLNQVANIFDRHDLFISPTRGEAFGNAIIESLSAGLPALISDKTLWKPDKKGGLQVLTLNENLWLEAVTNWSKFSGHKLRKKRKAALNYALDYYKKNFALKKNKKLVYSVL